MNKSSEPKDPKLLTFGPFDILMGTISLSFYIQIFDNRSSKVFIQEFSNNQIIELTQNLCNCHQELYTLLWSGFENKTKNSEVTITETGVINYKCIISFPIDRVYKFELKLQEKEISDLQKLDFQIKKLGAKLTNLQQSMHNKNKLVLKEEDYQGGFSMILNSGYYSFTNQYKTITRNLNDNKLFKTVWGSKALDKRLQQTYSIKLDKINPEVDCLYACIGIGYSLHHGLNIYNCKGAYCITNGKAFIDGKEVFVNDFLFGGDVIKVVVDFEQREVKWLRNGFQIFYVGLIQEEIEAYDIYPIVSLSLFTESVSFVQN